MGITPSRLSFHLGKLRDTGLVFPEKRGKESWYRAAEDRVRYERHENGQATLTVTARGGGVAVTVAAPAS